MSSQQCIRKCMEYKEALRFMKGYIIPRKLMESYCEYECQPHRRAWRIKGHREKTNEPFPNSSHR